MSFKSNLELSLKDNISDILISYTLIQEDMETLDRVTDLIHSYCLKGFLNDSTRYRFLKIVSELNESVNKNCSQNLEALKDLLKESPFKEGEVSYGY